MLLSPPADGLLLVGDARLPERPVGLLQTQGDRPLQVIFIVPRQVDHVCVLKTGGRMREAVTRSLHKR